MIYYIVILTLIFVITFIVALYGKNGVGATVGVSIMMCAFGGLILFGLDSICFNDWEIEDSYCSETKYEEVTSSKELYSFKGTTATGTQGSFFLIYGTGTGSTSSNNMCYKYYIKTNKGLSYQEIELDTDNPKNNPYIKFDNDNPRIEKVETFKDLRIKSKPNFWTGSLAAYKKLKDYKVGDVYSKHQLTSKETVTIYIPEDSMLNEYNVDIS